MSTENERRDLAAGVPIDDLRDGKTASGRVGDDDVLVVRRGDKFYAIGAKCTHYSGPLGDGLVVGDTVRCPWHHACFSLETGEALRAPALDPVSCWRVEVDGARVFVREKMEPAASRTGIGDAASWPSSVVILGGGAAGVAGAEMLRREGYDRSITIISSETTLPVDRPNLSKDYLSGHAQPDWLPLRGEDFYREQRIDLLLDTRADAIDGARKVVRVGGSRDLTFGALLVATGAEPVRLSLAGADLPHVHYLRSWADTDSIIKGAAAARRVVVIGASFIGLEVAASLRTRGLDVHVIGPEATPLERVLGKEVGGWVKRIHESHGVVFHLERQVKTIVAGTVTLSDGTAIEADLVVIGIGVKPRLEIAERAGLSIDRGILVDEYLQTSAPGIFAAGDVARWPDPRSGTSIRVEHWVVAERMGQAAARNMLGARAPFTQVPFFWSQHYDTPVNYVGHAETWDAIEIDGDLDRGDCAVTYSQGGRRVALATIGRDRQSLEFEAALEAAPAR